MKRLNAILATCVAMCFAGTAPAQIVIYDNTTTSLSAQVINGGATSTITRLVADDIHFATGTAGQNITGFSFTVFNADTVSFSARPRVRFWLPDGTGGGPGTYYNSIGFSFSPITFVAGDNGFFTASFATPVAGFTVPAGEVFWAGMTFDNSTATATTANLNNLGQDLYNPPLLGSSTDMIFTTTAPGSFFNVSNPAGTLSNFGGSPFANIGWQFTTTAVPEPSSMVLAGIFGVGSLLRWRRRKVA